MFLHTHTHVHTQVCDIVLGVTEVAKRKLAPRVNSQVPGFEFSLDGMREDENVPQRRAATTVCSSCAGVRKDNKRCGTDARPEYEVKFFMTASLTVAELSANFATRSSL